MYDDRFFRPMWVGNGEQDVVPALDLYMTPEAVIAKVALPGVKPENVDVTIGDDLVTISARQGPRHLIRQGPISA